MKIGDRAASKETGFPTRGIVVAILDPFFYCTMNRRSPDGFKKWDQLFPDWKEKNVYVMKLDKPQKSCTWEEFLEYNPKGTKFEYETIPETIYIAFVEDDICLLTSLNN